MSSVASDPAFFPPAKAVNPGRSGSASDRSDNGAFAKLLDDEPAREPNVRAKHSESKTSRHDDSHPGNDAPQSDPVTDAKPVNEASPKMSDRSGQDSTAADAANTDTAAAGQGANEATEINVTGVTGFVPAPVEPAPVTIQTAVAAPAIPHAADPVPETAPPAPAAAPQGDAAPAAAPAAAPQLAMSNAAPAPHHADAATESASGHIPAAIAASGAMKAQQAAANTEAPAAQAQPSVETKPATTSPPLAQTEAPARAEQIVEPPLRPVTQRAATPGEAATDAAARPNDSAAVVKSGSELAQSLGFTAPAQHAAPSQSTAAAHAAAAAAPTPAPTPAVPVANVAFEIAAQSLAGKNRFEIRLDPPELGRIDVRLEIDNDGHVKSRLIVERSETLDMLRRDAPQLERALQQAGLKTSDNALEFSLRDQTQQHRDDDNGNGRRIGVADEGLPAADTIQHNYGRMLGLGGGLDIRV